MACVVALASAGVAVAGDPFEDARYFMGVKDNAAAIRLIDSGQFDINMQTPEGYTLLHYAADNGNLEMVRELIRRGADVNIRSASDSTPYDMAVGTMVQAEIARAGGRSGRSPAPSPIPQGTSARAASSTPATGKPASAPVDPRRKMCNARNYAASALCSDSTCKMREYRKWQTCLKTGSYY
ncbi:MAG TPA: ankyrin repeat domain-containing protein [Caulobacter sp.]|nr:ankyrin repeat domain-containing protein [Caulobacter sp.]